MENNGNFPILSLKDEIGLCVNLILSLYYVKL